MGFSAADLDKIIQQQKNVRGIDEAKNKEGAQPPVWNRNGAFLREEPMENETGAVMIPMRSFVANTRNRVVVYLLGVLFLFGMVAGTLMVRHASITAF